MMNFLLRSTSNSIKTKLTSQSRSRNAHTIRVILTKDIPENNQYAGETHHVKAGYARNYLIPKKKALYATPENFLRVQIEDPDLKEKQLQKTIVERNNNDETDETDEDVKAADFLKYYLRNKTLRIWRNIETVNVGGGVVEGGKLSFADNAPIHPGKVNQEQVREKLSKQLKIDLEDFEKVQIHPDSISFAALEEDETLMDKLLDEMEPLVTEGGSTEGDGECNVELKRLGEYLVKIHLKGDQQVGLRLAVLRR